MNDALENAFGFSLFELRTNCNGGSWHNVIVFYLAFLAHVSGLLFGFRIFSFMFWDSYIMLCSSNCWSRFQIRPCSQDV